MLPRHGKIKCLTLSGSCIYNHHLTYEEPWHLRATYQAMYYSSEFFNVFSMQTDGPALDAVPFLCLSANSDNFGFKTRGRTRIQ